MWTKHALTPAAVALGLAFAVAGEVRAQEAPASGEIAQATLHWTESADAAAPAAQPSDDKAADKKSASDETLGGLAGRGETTTTQVALTEQNLSAVNSGNTINGNTVASGAISLTDSALSGFNGVGNIVMNTGHNNNLQSTMSVTIVITP